MSDTPPSRLLDIPSPRPVFAASAPVEPAYVRSPVNAIRLLGWVAGLAGMFVALRNADAAQFADVGISQLGFLVPSILGFLSRIALRRFARVARMLLASVICVAGLIVMSKLVGRSTLPLLPPRRGAPTGGSGYGIGAAFPTTLDLGVIAAWMFIDRGHWSDRWLSMGRVVLALGIVARLVVSLATPATILTAVVMAMAATLLVQVILGARNTRPRPVVVGEVLHRLGYGALVALQRSGDL